MLTDMTPAAAGQLYPQLQSIGKTSPHPHADHPGLRGTPLAMLAAQCNKLSSKSPPPLADAAVGKGFHPWKKSPQSSGSSPQHTAGSGCTSTGVTQRPAATSSAGSTGGYSSRGPVTSCASAAPQYGGDLYFPGTASVQQAASDPHHHQSSILGKVEGATLSSVYGRHPYEAWPFNAMSGATHGGLKTSNDWWDMHGAATGGWLDVSGTVGVHAAQMANYSADYSTSLALAGNHLLSSATTGHNLLQDTYKSMLPGGPPSFGLHHHSPAGAGGAGSPQGAAGAAAGVAQAPSPRSQRRYTGRATCDCPNCQEAERLGPAGVHLRKKNIHSCHIPGCGKVYGKTSHLKAHLRWHTAAPAPDRRKAIRLSADQQAARRQEQRRQAAGGELDGRLMLGQRGQREPAKALHQQQQQQQQPRYQQQPGPSDNDTNASSNPAPPSSSEHPPAPLTPPSPQPPPSQRSPPGCNGPPPPSSSSSSSSSSSYPLNLLHQDPNSPPEHSPRNHHQLYSHHHQINQQQSYPQSTNQTPSPSSPPPVHSL